MGATLAGDAGSVKWRPHSHRLPGQGTVLPVLEWWLQPSACQGGPGSRQPVEPPPFRAFPPPRPKCTMARLAGSGSWSWDMRHNWRHAAGTRRERPGMLISFLRGPGSPTARKLQPQCCLETHRARCWLLLTWRHPPRREDAPACLPFAGPATLLLSRVWQ
ncbi:uncharacterized protein LOC124251849 isoform X3 [Equus quagga]|uniref:uncharacterized protein LOC124251849 isoform X3 n=1 Tax=Equus quagga TaxID=89248 RepID=UPI001EE15A23|nr:uncharacterized protein LOC124251849 isoform X3 [Equus quagga]